MSYIKKISNIYFLRFTDLIFLRMFIGCDCFRFELTEAERDEIRHVMKEHHAHKAPTTPTPVYNTPKPHKPHR